MFVLLLVLSGVKSMVDPMNDTYKMYTVGCEINYVLKRCKIIGKAKLLYGGLNYCTATPATNVPIYLDTECEEMRYYAPRTIEKATNRSDSLVCPHGSELTDCRVVNNRDDYTSEMTGNSCFVKSITNSGKKVNFEATCLEKRFIQIESIVVERDNKYFAEAACPKGTQIVSCRCAEPRKCFLTDVYKNKCIAAHINYTSDVGGVTKCTTNFQSISGLLSGSTRPYTVGFTNDCLIKIGPKSTETHFEVMNRLIQIYTRGCMPRPYCNNCTTTKLTYIPMILPTTAHGAKRMPCFYGMLVQECYSKYGPEQPYVSNNTCISENVNQSSTVVCRQKSRDFELIFRRFSFSERKLFEGGCAGHGKFISCMLGNRVKGPKFVYKNDKCYIFGANLIVIVVCEQTTAVMRYSDVVFMPKHLSSFQTVRVDCPVNYKIFACSPVYAGKSFIKSRACYAVSQSNNSFLQTHVECLPIHFSKDHLSGSRDLWVIVGLLWWIY